MATTRKQQQLGKGNNQKIATTRKKPQLGNGRKKQHPEKENKKA